jgi:trehalose utilization protein
MTNIQTMGEKVREKLRGAKEMVRKTIDEGFVALEKEINKQLEKYHEERSIYSLVKSERQDQVLVEYIDELNMMRSSLKSEKGISNIIYFYREKHEDVESFHS